MESFLVVGNAPDNVFDLMRGNDSDVIDGLPAATCVATAKTDGQARVLSDQRKSELALVLV